MSSRVVSWAEAVAWREEERGASRRVVFTNGCFDILHRGHIDLLEASRALGDALIVGVNTDASVTRLKGAQRPWVGESDRAHVLAALRVVDRVVLFSEDTPRELIRRLLPDVLVKGADYRPEDVVGGAEVIAAGGRVELVQLTPGRSTTALIHRLEGRSGN